MYHLAVWGGAVVGMPLNKGVYSKTFFSRRYAWRHSELFFLSHSCYMVGDGHFPRLVGLSIGTSLPKVSVIRCIYGDWLGAARNTRVTTKPAGKSCTVSDTSRTAVDPNIPL